MFIGEIKDLDLADVTSNLPENEAPNYVGGTTYNIGDEVIYSHVVYGCLVDGTVSRRPDSFSSRYQTPQYWQVKGPTNAFAAVDGVLATPTVNPDGDIVFTISNFANISGVAIFDAKGASATADFFDALGALIDTQTINLLGFNLNSYYEWLFSVPSAGNSNYIFSGFPVNTVKTVVTIAGDATSLGEVNVIANGYQIGNSLYGSKVNIASRSVYQDDDFGVPRFIKRPSRVNSTFEVLGEQTFVDTLWGALRSLSGSRVVCEAQKGRPVTTGIGIVRDITVPIAFPRGYIFSIEIEGVQ